jgi:hypothetical protein
MGHFHSGEHGPGICIAETMDQDIISVPVYFYWKTNKNSYIQTCIYLFRFLRVRLITDTALFLLIHNNSIPHILSRGRPLLKFTLSGFVESNLVSFARDHILFTHTCWAPAPWAACIPDQIVSMIIRLK